MGQELPTLKITFPDGSTWEASKNQSKAFIMKIQEDQSQKILKKLVEKTEEHWQNHTVPTKFNWDESWFSHFKDQLHYDNDCEWYPEPKEIDRRAEERINWDQRVKELFGEDWGHPYPRTYIIGTDKESDGDYPEPFQVRESGEKLERKMQDDITLPKVDTPTWWKKEDTIRYIILPSEMYEEWEDLLVERMEAEVEVSDEVDQRAKEEMPEPYFENMADLADTVFYYNFRGALMSLAMAELDEDNRVEVMELGDGRISHYKGENVIHYDTSGEDQ